MIRYFKLYLYFIQFSFSKALEFRLDFFFRVVMDCIYYAVNISFYGVLFKHTSQLGDWRLDQIHVFIGSYFVLDALIMTICSNNIWWLPTYINRGDLDHYLVKPVSSLFFASFREFAANSFLNLVIALSFWVWAILNYHGDIELWNLLLYLFLIFCGTSMYYSLQMLTIIPVFWTQSPHAFTELFYSTHTFMERPHKIFSGWLRWILVTILPFSLMASVPTEFFFNPDRWELFAGVTLAASLFVGFMIFMWNRGLSVYNSASS